MPLDIGHTLETFTVKTRGGKEKQFVDKDIYNVLLSSLKKSLPGLSNTKLINESLMILSNHISAHGENIDKVLKSYEDKTGVLGLVVDNLDNITSMVSKIFSNFGEDIENSIVEQFNNMGDSLESLNEIYESAKEKASDFSDKMFSPMQSWFSKIPFLGDYSEKIFGPLKKKVSKSITNKIFMPMEDAASKSGEIAAKYLLNPYVLAVAAIGILIGKTTSDFIKTSQKIADNLGITFTRAGDLASKIQGVTYEGTKYGLELDDITETAIELSKQLNTLSIPEDVLRNAALAQKALGLETSDIASLQSTIVDNMKVGINDSDSQRKIYAQIVAESERLNISAKNIAENISESRNAASSMLLITEQQRKNFIKQVAEATKLGKSLDDVKETFDTYDDVIEGIQASNALAQATGIYIDAQKVFALRMKGDFVSATNYILDQVEEARSMITDPSQFQLMMKIMSKQLGTSENDLTTMIEKRSRARQEEANKAAGILSFEERLNQLYKDDFGLMDKQSPFQRMWLDIKGAFMPALQALQPVALSLVNALFKTWQFIKPVFDIVGKIATIVIKVLAPAFRLVFNIISAIFKLLTWVMQGIKMVTFGIMQPFESFGDILDIASSKPEMALNAIPNANIDQITESAMRGQAINNSPRNNMQQYEKFTFDQPINLNVNLESKLDGRKLNSNTSRHALTVPITTKTG